MKILFFLAVWRRPEITEICFMGLNRLKKSGLFPVDFLAVISEESMKTLCKKYGIDYVMHENLPLGRKKNFGLTEAFKKDWDYLIELGSDDILKTELLEIYKPYFFKNPVLGISSFCYLNADDLECRVVKSSVFYGAGRAIERQALEKIAKGVEIEALDTLISPGRSVHKGETGFFPKRDAEVMEKSGMVKVLSEEKYKLWNDTLNKCLDNNSNFFMAANGVLGKKVDHEEPVLIDIKSDVNIWPWSATAGHTYDLDKALTGLSEDEISAIKYVCQSQTI